MGGSDSETELKKKKEKKDKDKGGDKDEKKDKKDKHKDERKDKDKDEKKDKDKDGKKDKDKKDKDKDGKKDKDKKEKGKDEKKDKEKGKEKGKEKKDKKDKKDEDEDEDDEEDGKKKKKKDKDKDKKDKPSQSSGINVSSGPVSGGEAAGYYSGAPSQPSKSAHPPQSGEVPWFLREPGTEPLHDQRPPRAQSDFPNPNPQYTFQQPPQHQASRAVGDVGGGQPPQNVPLSGYRIPLDPNAQFPSPDQLGRPPTTDFDGSTPVFIGSAIFPDSVQPCKIVPSLNPPCRVPYGGSELEHHGRYDLLPITQDMEWVPTRDGRIPPGRRPVEGGYESNGGKLYHALGSIQGVHIPGKAGNHLRGASIPFGGSECNIQENYSILCWK